MGGGVWRTLSPLWVAGGGSDPPGAAFLFFGGARARLGPATASLLGTLEPVVTVLSAAVAFGERLTPLQMGGALMVLSALVVCRPAAGGRQRQDVPVLVLEPTAAAQAGAT